MKPQVLATNSAEGPGPSAFFRARRTGVPARNQRRGQRDASNGQVIVVVCRHQERDQCRHRALVQVVDGVAGSQDVNA